MPKVRQLTVSCANRPGTLAELATVMGAANVNIMGFHLATSGARGHVKLIVDKVEEAKSALDDAGFNYTEQAVLHARLANVPGALGRFASRLAAKAINIVSGYQTIERDAKRASVVLEVTKLDVALRVRTDTPSSRLYGADRG
jgi:hypothetical protein